LGCPFGHQQQLICKMRIHEFEEAAVEKKCMSALVNRKARHIIDETFSSQMRD
jgi:hypothetical protein